MTLLLECIISALLFTVLAICLDLKDPLGVIGDYPPAIRQRCVELGLIEERKERFTARDLLRKGLAMVLFALIFAFVLRKVNGISTFIEGFRDSYIIWLFIAWWDALVVDCGWFCHSKKMRIPGTEDMKEYKDYLFHIKQSLIGTVLGLPVCLLTGLFVSL